MTKAEHLAASEGCQAMVSPTQGLTEGFFDSS